MTHATYNPQWSIHIHGAPSAVTPNPTFLRILARLPVDVRSSLSNAQLVALADAARPPRPRHLVDYRVSLPWFGGGYYLTVLFGKERRDRSRLVAEGQIGVGRQSIAYFIVALAGAMLLTTAVGGCIYIVKESLGIDFFDGPSTLADLVQLSSTSPATEDHA